MSGRTVALLMNSLDRCVRRGLQSHSPADRGGKIMTSYWILAADSTEARLFTRDKKYGPLVERQDWLHPESRAPGRDLEDDRQGSTFSSQGHDRSANQKPTEPKT